MWEKNRFKYAIQRQAIEELETMKEHHPNSTQEVSEQFLQSWVMKSEIKLGLKHDAWGGEEDGFLSKLWDNSFRH